MAEDVEETEGEDDGGDTSGTDSGGAGDHDPSGDD